VPTKSARALRQRFGSLASLWRSAENSNAVRPADGTSRRPLKHLHHVYRSAGGSEEDTNLTALCWWCHQRGIHGGLLRVTGCAPDRLTWEIGCRPDGPPLQVFHGSTLAAQASAAL
jgi:hypothetical protein